MAGKFEGTLDDLKALLEQAGFSGRWSDDGRGKHSFRSLENGVLNWWPNTGSLNFQGKAESKTKLEALFEDSVSETRVCEQNEISGQKNIFIVHGHDSDALDQLELALHRLGLQPFILMNAGGRGETIIEALEGRIGRDFTSDFGIVLMTPDDFGY